MSIAENIENLKSNSAEQGLLIVSAIRYETPVGKPYGYQNGEVTKANNHRTKKAVGETYAFQSFDDFIDWRKPLITEYMLVSGTFETVGDVPVVYKGEEKTGEVSASKKYLVHREQPGIFIGDIDFKEPDEVAGIYLGGHQPYTTQEAALNALSKVLPEANDCALLIGWSTSSNIFKGDKQVKGKGGIRIYLPVTDASKIPEILDIMHKRSWTNGEGWGFVDKAGQFQERSLFDQALKTVTQPDYAAPDLHDGLTQDREWAEYEGGWLDPDTVVPLTPDEEEEYQTAVAIAKNTLAPEIEAQRKVWLAKNAKEHEKKGLDPKRAMAAAIQLLDNCVLFPTGIIFFDDGSEVSVLDLLTDGSEYDGKTCKDPVERDYNGGASVGQFYWHDGEGPGIHSFAHGSKWYAIKHSAESAKDTFEGGDYDEISLAVAQTSFASKSEELQLEKLAAKALGLGQSVKPFRADVAEIKNRLRKRRGNKGLDARDRNAITEGRWSIDKPLPLDAFPFTRDGSILSHATNYKAMMAGYGYGCSYDVIKKEVFWTGPQINMDTDNAYLGLFSKMKGLAAMNRLPHGNTDLNAHLPAIAEENQINPVRDYLGALKWDGNDRIEGLVKAIEPHDTEVAEIALRVWFTGAAAACEHFEIGKQLIQGARPSFEYVLALLGTQGVNKTKGFLGFVPNALSKYAKDGVTLNPRDKDSVKIAVSHWLVELGELDATFKQGQIADLKAFLSTEADELRLPYAQGYSKFKRRTAFIGTVNQDKFLKDATGNRRYLALECGKGFPMWSADEVDQLWAQVWARYISGAQWWPTSVEQKVLDVNAERFLQHSWAETRIREMYDFSRPTQNNKRTTATLLHGELTSNHYGQGKVHELNPQQLNELRAAMKKLWSENAAYMRKGEQVIDTENGTVKTYAEGGKNKGWLVPMTVDEVEKSDEVNAKKKAQIERVEEIVLEIRADFRAKGNEPPDGSVRKMVMTRLTKEFNEKNKTAAFPSIFPLSEWESVLGDIDGLGA